MNRIVLMLCVFTSFAIAGNAQRGKPEVPCTVSDPTGSPLNVRVSPNGRIIGKLNNGTHVMIPAASGDEWTNIWKKKGRKWIYVGVVIGRYLDCSY